MKGREKEGKGNRKQKGRGRGRQSAASLLREFFSITVKVLIWGHWGAAEGKRKVKPPRN